MADIIKIGWLKIIEPINLNEPIYPFDKLPRIEWHSLLKQRQWQERAMAFYAKRLLAKMLHEEGYDKSIWSKWTRNCYKKPQFENGPLVSYAHSGLVVVAAIHPKTAVGIDIEELVDFEWRELRGSFYPAEWQAIEASDEPVRQLYYFWTRKEAMLKAVGVGLQDNFETHNTIPPYVQYENAPYYIDTLNLTKDTVCSISHQDRNGKCDYLVQEYLPHEI